MWQRERLADRQSKRVAILTAKGWLLCELCATQWRQYHAIAERLGLEGPTDAFTIAEGFCCDECGEAI